MRLIDADDLREFPNLPESGTEDMITNYIYECGLGDLELYVTEECPIDVEQALKDLCRKVIGSFKNIIDTQPTAYDVEKVVEEERNFLVNYGVPETAPVHRKIIGIIKGGLK